jgi:hypothetical protein
MLTYEDVAKAVFEGALATSLEAMEYRENPTNISEVFEGARTIGREVQDVFREIKDPKELLHILSTMPEEALAKLLETVGERAKISYVLAKEIGEALMWDVYDQVVEVLVDKHGLEPYKG